jgi:hypothetical protein
MLPIQILVNSMTKNNIKKMKLNIKNFLINPKTILLLYLCLTIIVTAQSILSGSKKFEKCTLGYKESTREYTHYNNYIIFKQSYFHLKEGKDLYKYYLEEHADLYKYTPSFAIFMGILAYFPDFIGLCLWNLLNAIILFLAIKYIPSLTMKNKCLILLFILVELVTSMRNSQSNGLITGLIILTFVFLERNQYFLASLSIVLCIFIKIFGIVAFVIFLFYPKKLKLLLYTLLCFVGVFSLPLLVVNFEQLKILYSSWFSLLSQDHAVNYGYSVMGLLKIWFNVEIPKNIIVLVGIFLFCLPLIRIKQYQNFHFRLLTLSSVLIWVVIFNHKAESPTFIIAVTGVATWFFSQEMKKENLTLLFIAFIFTSLSPTDIFPRFIKDQFFLPYLIKVVPCILIWLKIIYEMTLLQFKPELNSGI